MNARQFFDTVAEMRKNQKKYFETRSVLYLRESKRLEKEIDYEIQRAEKQLNAEPENTQQTLFE